MNGINVNLLKAKLVERGMNVSQLAEMIGIDRATIYRKLKDGGSGLLISEVNAIIMALNLTIAEAVAIFFTDQVA